MLIKPECLHMLVDRGEEKFTLLKLTKYYFTAAHLDTRYFCFIDRMQTWITVVDENGYNLRLAGQPTVCLVKEKGFYFEA